MAGRSRRKTLPRPIENQINIIDKRVISVLFEKSLSAKIVLVGC